jgi:hypothetical protein
VGSKEVLEEVLEDVLEEVQEEVPEDLRRVLMLCGLPVDYQGNNPSRFKWGDPLE